MAIFNRQKSLEVAQAKEDARGAAFATANKRDDAAYRAAMLYLDAERAARLSELTRRDIDSRLRMLDAVKAQVQEGRALPLAQKQAELAIAQARQAALEMDDQRDSAETSLAIALGFPADDRVAALGMKNAPAPSLPPTPADALQAALGANNELRQLQSQMASKELEIRGTRLCDCRASTWWRNTLCWRNSITICSFTTRSSAIMVRSAHRFKCRYSQAAA